MMFCGLLLYQSWAFTAQDEAHSIYKLAVDSSDIESVIYQDEAILAEKEKELVATFSAWSTKVREALLGITEGTVPKALIRSIAGELLAAYNDSRLLDEFDVYDCLLNYWNAKLQDDVYIIKASGYEAGREIEYEYAKKKAKDENGETISVDDKSKVKSFDGAIIPREIIERVYFAEDCAAIATVEEESGRTESELDEMREEESGEDGLLREALSESGDSIPKANLTKRIKELDSKKSSPEADVLTQAVELFAAGKNAELETLLSAHKELSHFELCGKNGKLNKTKINAALKQAQAEAAVPEIYAEEYAALTAYQKKQADLDATNTKLKEMRKALDDKVEAKYAELTVEEIKHLLFDEKWMLYLTGEISNEIDRVLNELSSRALLIARRYEHTLHEIEDKTSASQMAVKAALERMGYKW